MGEYNEKGEPLVEVYWRDRITGPELEPDEWERIQKIIDREFVWVPPDEGDRT